ncbi:tRNA preQ1(34) S-adenosylmethionine ribosyltransferase-isomerase QueA [Methylovirgula sp. 4M-Z18]|uniref:tRNA preQ1(34) S-adenosylmethionine ribosyltransferase-isomerase QueA n=1 Tax=Methylovirgula sp. 4M-Z18 TaxID=2293567 RepID=UPI000E2EABF5|nr:tRNA preQ1(34) S-adenosylmethionine ribosyltransferase-isomerase QueA [Methylovirgula sp. 4M-Z18]RFB80559.1 tRNA preQ1(34) S-adenosylmethionine ribosyltransferase-isomerase QueA [Methylovirgula sp. 4M-Z18]
MRVDLFDFELPEDRIALRPMVPREAAKLLVVAPDGALSDHHVGDLPDFLRPGDALVVNDTRVLPARLYGIRRRGDAVARIEALLHKREGAHLWRAFVRPAKKLKVGERVQFGEDSNACFLGRLDAQVVEKTEGGEVLFAFDLSGGALDDAIVQAGHMPLPPYIASKRPDDAGDLADYQTMFARETGAVAAPTAGLHFTPELLARVEAKGVAVHRVTLHVGAGTFLPVKVDDTDAHQMHAEFGVVTPEVATALNAARANGARIVTIGTTSLRILESAASAAGEIRPFAGDTSIFITPGYRFRAVDILMTNFHLPRSTLFMLVSAFSGLETMKVAYAHAVANDYRFYSYGDACLLMRA